MINLSRPVAVNPRPVVPDFKVGDCLTEEYWKMLDDAMVEVSRYRFQVFGVLEAHGCGIVEEYDAFRNNYEGLPLPTIHTDFYISKNEFLLSPLFAGKPQAEMAAHVVAAKVERMLLGVNEVEIFNDRPLYGFCNHPNRQIKTGVFDNMSPDSILKGLTNAKTSMRERGYDKLLAIMSYDWCIYEKGLKEHFDTMFTEIIISEHLPYGTIVLIDLSPKTIIAYTDLDLTVGLWSSTPDEVNMRVICRKVPILYDGRGVLVLSNA